MRQKSVLGSIAALLAILSLAVVAVVAQPTGAGAQTGEFRKGPDPTEASVRADRGPFATTTASVSSLVAGFGGGTIHYPTTTSQGTFGAIAFAPGFTASSSSYAWIGPRIASQGFVVFLINTDSRFDFPASRATSSRTRSTTWSTRAWRASRIDRNRLAVGGHSMGGGGRPSRPTTTPACRRPSRSSPGTPATNFSGVNVPTMIVGAENDTIASVSSHSEPFYNSIPASAEKAYVELNGATHGVGTTANVVQAKSMIVWLKRYVDNDTRYEQFICPPPPAPSAEIQEYRNTCPG